jgi:hypothetical protein
MCMSEASNSQHTYHISSLKGAGSAPGCCHVVISLSTQAPELVDNQSFRLSGPRGAHKSGNRNWLHIKRYR